MATNYTLDDFRTTLDQVGERGLREHIGRLPGLSVMAADGEDPKAALKRAAALIEAMTPAERHDPSLIDAAAKSRIATAVGRTPNDVDQLLTQFAAVRDVMRKLGEMSFWQRLKLVMGFGRPPG